MGRMNVGIIRVLNRLDFKVNANEFLASKKKKKKNV